MMFSNNIFQIRKSWIDQEHYGGGMIMEEDKSWEHRKKA